MLERRRVRKIALIGNYVPRQCGIATFTFDVCQSLERFENCDVDVYAMNDGGNVYHYPPPVVRAIQQDSLDQYISAADHINRSNADIVCLQHEYGIFGGPAGNYILGLLERVRAPIVVTLHTVLDNPDAEQRLVITRLADIADHLVVMAEKGRQLLRDVHQISDDKIRVIPHGAPDRPLSDGKAEKGSLGLAGRDVLLTFGLLSPNKGIETVIHALPDIVAAHPNALYLVLGATHPHLIAHEGEAYRDKLKAMARQLGVGDAVRFVDGFLEQGDLLDYLTAADIYVTPYLYEAQVTSGTLTYAVALGRPVVSSPYWHAVELLGDGTGIIAPFGESQAFSAALSNLLGNPDSRKRISILAYTKGRQMIWSQFARAYLALFDKAVADRLPQREPLYVKTLDMHRPAHIHIAPPRVPGHILASPVPSSVASGRR